MNPWNRKDGKSSKDVPRAKDFEKQMRANKITEGKMAWITWGRV
jgi:hypothetical protein